MREHYVNRDWLPIVWLVAWCGRLAQQGLQKADIPHIPAPHPAWRALSIAEEQRIRQQIEVILNG